MRMRGLAAALLYTTGGLTRLMDRRVRDGSVAREVSATDRRVIYAALTDRGVATIRKASKSHLWGVQRHFGALFEDAELGAVAPFMSCIAHAQDADPSGSHYPAGRDRPDLPVNRPRLLADVDAAADKLSGCVLTSRPR